MTMPLVDENAYGFMLDLYGIEELEYDFEAQEFVGHFTHFRNLVLEEAAKNPLGTGALAMDFGHALYFEVGDGDQTADPIQWIRKLCLPVVQAGFELAAIVTHGGRWIDAFTDRVPGIERLEGFQLLRVSYPSEPLQRALYAAASCHGPDGCDGWGTGLFVDAEALLALGKQLKNAPTPLVASGATFYRLSLPSA